VVHGVEPGPVDAQAFGQVPLEPLLSDGHLLYPGADVVDGQLAPVTPGPGAVVAIGAVVSLGRPGLRGRPGLPGLPGLLAGIDVGHDSTITV
jgi:hypothetical protein